MIKKTIILCEGEMDKIILSHYMIARFEYKYKKDLKGWTDEKHKNESASLYKREKYDDELIIWATGSHELLGDAFEIILNLNKVNTDVVYSRIVIIADHDSDQENKKLWDTINGKLKSQGVEVVFREQKWLEIQQKLSFDVALDVELLGISIPLDKNGALETFLLDALAEQEKNKYLANSSQKFVHSLEANMDKMGGYLSNRRLCVKAPLCVFLPLLIQKEHLGRLRISLDLSLGRNIILYKKVSAC